MKGLDFPVLRAKAAEASGVSRRLPIKKKDLFKWNGNNWTVELAQGRDGSKAQQGDVGSSFHLLPRASGF